MMRTIRTEAEEAARRERRQAIRQQRREDRIWRHIVLDQAIGWWLDEQHAAPAAPQ